MADHLFTDDTRDVEGKFIGWDYSHYGDYLGYDRYYGCDKEDKKWTTQEIFEEVKDACYQLKQLEEESPADELFEELGYEKDEDEISVYYTYKKFGNMIVFNLKSKEIHFHSDGIDTIGSITLQELKAINKKVQELGWV